MNLFIIINRLLKVYYFNTVVSFSSDEGSHWMDFLLIVGLVQFIWKLHYTLHWIIIDAARAVERPSEGVEVKHLSRFYSCVVYCSLIILEEVVRPLFTVVEGVIAIIF